MSHLFVLFAEMDPSDLIDTEKRFMDPRIYGILLMAGSIALAVLIGTIWAVLYSKKKKNSKHQHPQRHQRREPLIMAAADKTTANAQDEDKSRKKRKKMRRPHRPLNPTLAQTRGLPPMRDPNSAPPLP